MVALAPALCPAARFRRAVIGLRSPGGAARAGHPTRRASSSATARSASATSFPRRSSPRWRARPRPATRRSYGWSWPIFGIAAAASTFAAAPLRRRTERSPRLARGPPRDGRGRRHAARRRRVAGDRRSALLVGGTFMVVTMVGMQEARRVAGAGARRLMAAMTSAFAAGQIAGSARGERASRRGRAAMMRRWSSPARAARRGRAGAHSEDTGATTHDRSHAAARPRGDDPGPAGSRRRARSPARARGVFGPFIPLLRSPELHGPAATRGRVPALRQRVMPAKLNEFAMLVTARHVTNQFEWAVHHPLAIKAGVAQRRLDAIGRARRPQDDAGRRGVAARLLPRAARDAPGL